jgi:four helix bundle protein
VEKSGTSIRANVAEGQQAQSRADFIAKLSLSLKETSETKYWLSLLHDTGYLTDREYRSIQRDCIEIEKILTSILKTTKSNTVSK